MLSRAATLLALASSATPLAAHQLYVMPSSFQVSNGERITVALHNGDSFPESEVAPALERIRDFAVTTAKAQYNVTNLRIDDKRALGDARIPSKGTIIVSARTVPNFLELPAADFEKYLKEEGLTAAIAARREQGETGKPGRELYSKYVKALVHAGSGVDPKDDTYARALGFAIEFIPERDPYALKSGDRLPVRLLWKGKPAAGILVEASRADSAGVGDSQRLGFTDADGRVQVFLSAPGRWRLTAVAIERCADASKADWESNWASLTFEVLSR